MRKTSKGKTLVSVLPTFASVIGANKRASEVILD